MAARNKFVLFGAYLVVVVVFVAISNRFTIIASNSNLFAVTLLSVWN